jgi:hypothetical protein
MLAMNQLDRFFGDDSAKNPSHILPNRFWREFTQEMWNGYRCKRSFQHSLMPSEDMEALLRDYIFDSDRIDLHRADCFDHLWVESDS